MFYFQQKKRKSAANVSSTNVCVSELQAKRKCNKKSVPKRDSVFLEVNAPQLTESKVTSTHAFTDVDEILMDYFGNNVPVSF